MTIGPTESEHRIAGQNRRGRKHLAASAMSLSHVPWVLRWTIMRQLPVLGQSVSACVVPQPRVEVLDKQRTWFLMNDAVRPTQLPECLRGRAIAALIPFFIDDPRGETETARLAAEAMLDDFKAATPKELQL